MTLLKSPLRRRCEKKLREFQTISKNSLSFPKIDGKIQRKVHHIDIQIELLKELLKLK